METLYQEQEALPNMALSRHSPLISRNIPFAHSAPITLAFLLFHKHANLLPASETSILFLLSGIPHSLIWPISLYCSDHPDHM